MQQREMLVQSGQEALENGKFSVAVAQLRKALDADPNDLEVRLLVAEALAEDGKLRPALKVLDEAPEGGIDTDLCLLRGDLLLQDGQIEKAQAAYRKAQELEPDSEDAWVSLGLVDSAMEHHPS